ncbi:MAG: hypothetical protein ABI321_24865 [Polyangia bacterium]
MFLLSLLGASLGGCYQVDEPVCAYACGVGSDGGGKSCPRNYECRGDNYCHKVGTTAACEYSDASVIDQAVVSADFSSIDQDSADLSLSDASSD